MPPIPNLMTPSDMLLNVSSIPTTNTDIENSQTI